MLVDWTGGGRGPRLWSLGFLLYSVGARDDLARVDRAVAGYRQRVAPPAELDRLAAAVRARPVIFAAWGLLHGPRAGHGGRPGRGGGPRAGRHHCGPGSRGVRGLQPARVPHIRGNAGHLRRCLYISHEK